jgi:hypothetical protein
MAKFIALKIADPFEPDATESEQSEPSWLRG